MQKYNTPKTTLVALGLWFMVSLFLRLTGIVAWSWLWVTMPLWIPLVAIVWGIIVISSVEAIKKAQ